jgi:hypothetical protein
MSADGRTLIGWHPEPEHPYEHTKVYQTKVVTNLGLSWTDKYNRKFV